MELTSSRRRVRRHPNVLSHVERLLAQLERQNIRVCIDIAGVLIAAAAAQDPQEENIMACFLPHIESGVLQLEDVNEEFISALMGEPDACAFSETKELMECVWRIVSNFTGYTDRFVDAATGQPIIVYVDDLIGDWLCEAFMLFNQACDVAMSCEQGPVFLRLASPYAGSDLSTIPVHIDRICREPCLAGMMAHCPITSVVYARGQTLLLPIIQEGAEQTMLNFVNHTCPYMPDMQGECATSEMSTPNFTDCIHRAVDHDPDLILFLHNTSYPRAPEDLVLDCRAFLDLASCIETHVGGGCDYLTASVIVDGLFTLGFLFNMSTCEPRDIVPTSNEGNMSSGVAPVAMESTVAPVILSISWMIISCFDIHGRLL